MRGCHKRGLSQVVTTLLLVIVSITAFVGLYAVYTGVFNSAVGGYNLSDENSLITVNQAEGTGMILFVLNNHGPSTLNLYNVTIVDDNGNDIALTPTSRTQTQLTCVQVGSTPCAFGSSPITGLIVAGGAVGYSTQGKFLVVPSGAQISFQINITAGMGNSFTAGNTYKALIRPSNGPLTLLQVTATSD